MTPLLAILRLADEIIDGGQCQHCDRVTAISDRWEQAWPATIADQEVCWYVFDPETETFRRSCEGG